MPARSPPGPNGVDPGHEPAEPQHPAQQSRAVADRGAAPPVQLPLADPQVRRDLADLRPGRPSRCAAALTSGSGGPAAAIAAGNPGQAAQGHLWLERAGQQGFQRGPGAAPQIIRSSLTRAAG